jgi:DNA-binding response OmpR family regulator
LLRFNQRFHSAPASTFYYEYFRTSGTQFADETLIRMALTSIEPSTGSTLLIVDDDRSAREGLRSIFETAGHRTIAVADAPAALSLLRKRPCDLVLLDVELPDVDGLALCRLLRAQPSLNQLPLVVFSANDSEGRKVEAFTAGADDYIVKPSTPGELLSRINSHLNGAQRESELRGSNRELSFPCGSRARTLAHARAGAGRPSNGRLDLRRYKCRAECLCDSTQR